MTLGRLVLQAYRATLEFGSTFVLAHFLNAANERRLEAQRNRYDFLLRQQAQASQERAEVARLAIEAGRPYVRIVEIVPVSDVNSASISQVTGSYSQFLLPRPDQDPNDQN